MTEPSAAAIVPITAAIADAFDVFANVAAEALAGPGNREDQLRPPLVSFLRQFGSTIGSTVVPFGEVSLSDLDVRPDYAISVDGAITGYVELKAPGKGADPLRWPPKSHDAMQWRKLTALPNVLLTDGENWALYRSGDLKGSVARVSSDLRKGAKAVTFDEVLIRIVWDFLAWEPVTPRMIEELVRLVADLCRLLRDQVSDVLKRERAAKVKDRRSDTPFLDLERDWRNLLFPTADDPTFADGYAQAVTFALLLARVDDIDFTNRGVTEIAQTLGKDFSLMGRSLDVLTNTTALGPLQVTVDLLARVTGVVDWELLGGGDDLLLHLYEHFLSRYDPKLRKATGSYYTPVDAVRSMVRLTNEALRDHLGVPEGFAAPNVTTIDPAMGSGTFLLQVLQQVYEDLSAVHGHGFGASAASAMLKRLIGFELQVGPFAVAELRVAEQLRNLGVTAQNDELRLYVANTLDDPYAEVGQMGGVYEPIASSRREANRVKAEEPIMVVIGNPPYKD